MAARALTKRALNLMTSRSDDGLDRLFAAVENRREVPPCNTCPLYSHCATERTACKSFLRWVDPNSVGGGGTYAHPALAGFPSRALYDWLYSGTEYDSGAVAGYSRTNKMWYSELPPALKSLAREVCDYEPWMAQILKARKKYRDECKRRDLSPHRIDLINAL